MGTNAPSGRSRHASGPHPQRFPPQRPDPRRVLPPTRHLHPFLPGVDPTVTLVANSIPCSRGRLQRGEPGATGPGYRPPRPPVIEAHHIERRRRQEVLEMRLRLSDGATPPQPAPPVCLFMRTLDTRPGRVPRPQLLGRLLAAGPLQCLVMLTRLQPDDSRLLLRLRTLRPRRTRRAIRAREPCLENHAVLWIGVRQPGDALFARRASHHLPVPVHHKAPLVEPLAGAGLPTGVLGYRADDRHTVLTLAL